MGSFPVSQQPLVKPAKGVAPISLFFLFVALVLFTAHVETFLNSPASPRSERRIIAIPPGKTFKAVAYQLHEQGLISEPRLLTLWARIQGITRMIQAGEYELKTDMNPRQILEALITGKVRFIQVTIPEGFTVADIARRLGEAKLVNGEDFLELAMDSAYASSLGLEGPTLEGYMFPETYRFPATATPQEIIESMVSRWKKTFALFQNRAREAGLTVREIMTLASMVEKETALPQEKPLIASVFFNRLKRNMRLECDPTVIYGLKEFDGNLTHEHLKMETPYNTYMRYGLPPGPIANPGLDSIRAVLYPADSDYFYFVSKNDGSHAFSHTLTAHQEAVRMYQERLKK